MAEGDKYYASKNRSALKGRVGESFRGRIGDPPKVTVKRPAGNNDTAEVLYYGAPKQRATPPSQAAKTPTRMALANADQLISIRNVAINDANADKDVHIVAANSALRGQLTTQLELALGGGKLSQAGFDRIKIVVPPKLEDRERRINLEATLDAQRTAISIPQVSPEVASDATPVATPATPSVETAGSAQVFSGSNVKPKDSIASPATPVTGGNLQPEEAKAETSEATAGDATDDDGTD